MSAVLHVPSSSCLTGPPMQRIVNGNGRQRRHSSITRRWQRKGYLTPLLCYVMKLRDGARSSGREADTPVWTVCQRFQVRLCHPTTRAQERYKMPAAGPSTVLQPQDRNLCRPPPLWYDTRDIRQVDRGSRNKRLTLTISVRSRHGPARNADHASLHSTPAGVRWVSNPW